MGGEIATDSDGIGPIVIPRAAGSLLPTYTAIALLIMLAAPLGAVGIAESSWRLFVLALVLCAGGWAFLRRAMKPSPVVIDAFGVHSGLPLPRPLAWSNMEKVRAPVVIGYGQHGNPPVPAPKGWDGTSSAIAIDVRPCGNGQSWIERHWNATIGPRRAWYVSYPTATTRQLFDVLEHLLAHPDERPTEA